MPNLIRSLILIVVLTSSGSIFSAEDANAAAVEALVKTDPAMHIILKDKAGKDVGMNKWSNDKLSVFVLTESGKPVQTIVADTTVKVPAVLKDQEVRVLITPASQREVDGKTVTVSAVYETRTRKVCATPEYTDYTSNGKTVLKYIPSEIGHDTDKAAPIKGKVVIGADEYDVIEAFSVVKDK